MVVVRRSIRHRWLRTLAGSVGEMGRSDAIQSLDPPASVRGDAKRYYQLPVHANLFQRASGASRQYIEREQIGIMLPPSYERRLSLRDDDDRRLEREIVIARHRNAIGPRGRNREQVAGFEPR